MHKILILSIFCFCIGYARTQEDIICPPSFDFWPHWNCSLFYNCSTDGNHLVYGCPVGLYFNPSFGCDFPFAVPECIGGTRAPPGSSTTPISEPTTTATAGTWTTPPITGSTSPGTTPSNDICPPSFDFWPHWNCSLFYNCSTDGNHLVYECPVGLYFNPSFGCDFPFAVPECVEGTRAPPDSITTPISEPSTSPTPPITGSTLPDTTPSNDICPEGSIFWAHSNCSQFYICVACGSPFVHSCVAGYFYSTTLGTCDLEENVVDCVDGTRPRTTPSPVRCPPHGTHKVPHPTRRDAFFLCVDGIRDPDYFVWGDAP